MKNKIKIDELYREGLRNAETPPPPESWEIISSRLDKKSRKRVLPLWIKWGAVAAGLALLITVLNFAIFDTPHPTPVVQEEENQPQLESPASKIAPQKQIFITEVQKEDQNAGSGRTPAEKTASKAASAKRNHINFGRNSAPPEQTIPETAILAENPSENVISEENSAEIASKSNISSEALAATPQKGEESALSEALNNTLSKEPFQEEKDLAKNAAKNEHFLNRLSISPRAGAVLFEMGNNNTIDEQFANHPGGSEVSMAYGVNLAYQISDKLKIRSGVNKMNFNYSTRQVDYAAAMSSRAINVPPMAMASNLVIAAPGEVNQTFGFIEVPMELEFKLMDKKLGLNLIGGASSYFLEENKISMSTAATFTNLGEAQNINQLSFSANLGLGVNYRVAPKFRLNLEPLFKYQFKTFTHSDSYTFGIYSGLSYSF